mmetsp:Transcript_12578/g.18999  ORF Transcript_12578/g.18999 Transcript_12578/m.18999 type:complete len:443 (-) Transcript_12578:295-1623(-)
MGSGVSSQSITNPLSDFYTIPDKYTSYQDLQDGLRSCGLESSELIIGIDFTKSNLYNGEKTFHGKSLHSLASDIRNPYQVVLHVICKTLSVFDDDNKIPCYGFGDVISRNQKVVSFRENDMPCNGLDEVEKLYKHMAMYSSLAGPTSFAPIIRKAIHIVAEHEFRYHILVIIADGQVTDSDLDDTKRAIVEASNFAISIVMVGVGDGPWDMMQQFDDQLPRRRFDNFQFVCMTDALAEARKAGISPEVGFSLQALMEVPEQYKLIRKLKLLDVDVATKYFNKLKLKPVICEPPPPARRASASFSGDSQSQIFGCSQSDLGKESTEGDVAMDPIYTRKSSPKKKPSRGLSRGYSTASSLSPPKRIASRQGPPDEFLCPITQELMQDPVIAQDGHTYERTAIEAWLTTGNGTSPMTNQPLTSGTLLPNFNLKSQISSWKTDSSS